MSTQPTNETTRTRGAGASSEADPTSKKLNVDELGSSKRDDAPRRFGSDPVASPQTSASTLALLGNLQALKDRFDVDPTCVLDDEYVCTNAAWCGHREVLEWAHQVGCKLYTHTFSQAARNGHFHILEWLWAHECPYDGCTFREAAASLDHDLLKSAHVAPPEPDTAATASEIRTRLLGWLKDREFPWDASSCARAAGNIQALMWLRARGCPWDELTCINACLENRLDVLQWARENGCPWDASHCAHIASEIASREMAAWIHANRDDRDRQV